MLRARLDEQAPSGFGYGYSVYQAEYSRTLLFTVGAQMEWVSGRVVDRTRSRLDGKGYTIDLSDANAFKLREILTPFVTAARRAGGSARRPSASPARSGGPSRSRDEVQAMRGWLRENRYTVKDRGRVPAVFVAAYETRTPAVAATNGSPAQKSRKGRKVNNVEFSGDGTE